MDAQTTLEQLAFGSGDAQLLNKYLNPPENAKRKYELRRQVRRYILRARPALVAGIKTVREFPEEQRTILQYVEKQFSGLHNIHWKSFTFTWDIHPNKLLTIIQKDDWVAEGGGFDYDFVQKGDNTVMHQPTAFTQQEI